MIRDAVLHFGNEQPLLVDLFERPEPSHTVLVCTNVRSLSGTKPIWIDQSASVFFFPFAIIRFVEIHPGAQEALGLLSGDAGADQAGPPAGRDNVTEPDLEIDEELLRRVREV
jgi:hypothetical protein